MQQKQQTYTHFGYETVTQAEKTAKVGEVFDSVANRYDLMNDLMSFGLHRIWKSLTTHLSFIKTGNIVLDCAAGTADISKKLAQLVGDTGQVIVSDINQTMLGLGRAKLIDAGLVENIEYVTANAESLPFRENYFDAITIGFGLRNVTDITNALACMQTILKPGGALIILEFSKPSLPGLAAIYDLYSFKVLPNLGKMIVGDRDSYQYLAESIRKHPDQMNLKSLLCAAGFDKVDYYNFSGGIVALHKAYKF
ncbi:MAG: bifunctional demethylmenaquinone methyltransferase/2-methoxy-6-polyprenyl-1,4-benzoquinol methylase UbiE [Pseudomonadota bacterium]